MSVDNSRTLTETLGRTSLLTPGQYAELTQTLQLRYVDPRALARQLLERGWLTSYQINQVFRGRCAELVLGPYVLLERLGEGGSGQVFKARHQHMNRIVALKLIRQELLTDREVVGRFQREIQLISALTHPHVVRAYDAGPVGPNYFLVMEYVEGQDLLRLVKEKGALPVAAACDYIRQAALGLHHIHEKSLVHRDIKPSNLFLIADDATVSPYGLLKILDLGLARLQRNANGEATRDLTDNGTVTMGTLDYMAPEQAIDFHKVDIRADIYSLGCAFYHILAGHPPFPGGTVAQKLLRHQQIEPTALEQVRADVPPAVAGLVRRMMAKRPADRFQVPGEVARVLSAFLPGGAIQANLPMVVAPAPVALPVPAQPGVSYPVAVEAVVIDASVRMLPAPPRKQLPALISPRRWLPALIRHPRLAFASTASFALLLASLLFFRGGDGGKSTTSAAQTGGESPAARPDSAPPQGPPSVYLSDLTESKFQGAAFGKNGFLGHDGNGNLGGVTPQTARIIVSGKLSAKGVSMLAPSGGAAQVTYRLGKQYTQIKGSVALHDGGWFSGSKITFVILGDGKPVWTSKVIGAKTDYPQEFVASIAGVDTLELQVTCTSLNSGVWPVWLDPQLSR